MKLFGFNILREEPPESIPTIAPKIKDDGAITISSPGPLSSGLYIDLEATVKNEGELVTKYRDISIHPEIDAAIDEVVNEAIVSEEGEKTVDILLDEAPIPPKIKELIQQEFDQVLKLLEFNTMPYQIFRNWYVDGRLYYLILLDKEKPLEGIKELRYLDPRKVRKIRQVKQLKDKKIGNIPLQKVDSEFYIYSDKSLIAGQTAQIQNFSTTATGVKIAKDSIVHVTSGMTNSAGNMVLSYLHKAIKPLNMLRSMEDSCVIYRISRAPERRIFYIDVGNLSHIKAEQYVKDIMTKHKNKVVYNAETGEIKDDRRIMCYSLDTKIPLLDGRTLTLETIIKEYKAGKKNWVYSCDPITGKFFPGPIDWAGITKKNTKVVKVTFDNGKSIICTPDHKFPVWGKGFIEAQNLIGESIIPGYRRMQKMHNSGNEYEQIFKNDTKKWEYTHREVSRWKDSVGLKEEMVHDVFYAFLPKNTIHHLDYNRFNNSPSNLKMMNRNDHMKYHWDMAKFGAGRRPNKSEDFTPEWKRKISLARKGKVHHCKTWKITTPDNEILIIENLNNFCREFSLNRTNIKNKFGSKKYHAEILKNHKAISVEYIEQTMDVGSITIDQNETYHSHHTYLLDAGVYTKNTMLEDFYIPRREGGKTTQIDTLPAGCLSMDTKVPLLDGRTLTINEISRELNDNKQLWAYSCDPKTGKIEPGLISWAGVTQKSAKVMKITLDNNEEIICTLDHKFPIYDKGFIRADELTINESMIPFYSNNNGRNGYAQIYQNNDKKWQLIHKMVIDWKESHNLREEFVYSTKGVFDVRHHKNHNKFDNTPENLVWMNWHDHQKYHKDHVPHNFAESGTKAAKQKMQWLKENDIQTYTNIKIKRINSLKQTVLKRNANKPKTIKLPLSTIRKNIWLSYSTEFKKEFGKRKSDSFKITRNKNKIFYEQLHKENQRLVIDNEIICKIIDIIKEKTSHQITIKEVVDRLNSDSRILEKFKVLNQHKKTPNYSIDQGICSKAIINGIKDNGYTSWSDFRRKESVHNHRIINIEYLSEPIEVGTLTVDGNEIYHNHHTFALSVGIFTKNSNLGQIEDIKYFQNKLYNSLNVPISRLNPEYAFDIGRATQISRDEVKFSKFIDRLRLKFSTLFLDILEKNLVLKRVLTPEEWNQIAYYIRFKYHRDNCFTELKDQELMQARFNLLMMADPYVGKYLSNKNVRTHILKQNEKDIEENDMEIAEEIDNPQYMPPEMDMGMGGLPLSADHKIRNN